MAESYSVKARLSATDSGFISTLKNALGATDSLASKLKSGFSFGILTGMGQKAFSSLTSGVSGLISEINSSNAAWKTFEGYPFRQYRLQTINHQWLSESDIRTETQWLQ